MEQILRSGLSALGLPEDCVPALERYAQLLLEKNKVMNLTAITEPEQVATLHFLDSLCLLQAVDFAGRTAADIGTGAGFPGLPLRIAVPSLRLTLLDAQGKRVDFLREVCGELGLSDVACVHARAEEFAAHRRESFDLVTSRAVAALPMLAELGLPLVRVGGRFIAMTEDLSPAIALATRLREAGIRAQLHCEDRKFKQKISYADKLKIPYVIFLGEDEISAGVVACKDMATGEQTKLEPAATVYRIKAGLAEKEKGSVILG